MVLPSNVLQASAITLRLPPESRSRQNVDGFHGPFGFHPFGSESKTSFGGGWSLGQRPAPAKLAGADFSNANLKGADLSEIKDLNWTW